MKKDLLLQIHEKKAAPDVEMKTKNISTKKSDSSIDELLKNEFLEEYELDMYDIQRKNSVYKPFKESKSLYQKIKDETIIWIITGLTVGGTYLIDKYIQTYLNLRGL